MKTVDDKMIFELNILKNRLDSGESIIQCLATMGVPLEGNREFLEKWQKLSSLMMEGRVQAARAVSEFVSALEDSNRLIKLVGQKTLSPRIQAYMSMGIIFMLIFSSLFLFPETLKPSYSVLTVSLSLCLLSSLCIHLLLKNFLKELSFLDWISFLRSLSLSLQCGMTIPAALVENLPNREILEKWPESLRNMLDIQYLEQTQDYEATQNRKEKKLWSLAERIWKSLCKNYQEGLPQVEIIAKLARLQEEEFKNWMLSSSEKLGYLLLIPLFTLSVPAVLILLFAPLLFALL